MKRLFEQDHITSHFLQSMWLEDYEKPLLGEALQKRVANGSVVPMLEKPKHDEIKKETDKLINIFYDGEKLTDLEVDI